MRFGPLTSRILNEAILDVTINTRLPVWGKGIGYSNCRLIEQSFDRETEPARLRVR